MCCIFIPFLFVCKRWVEQNPVEIATNVRELLVECIGHAREKLKYFNGTNGCDPQIVIKGLGVTNQRETVVAWNWLTGQPLYNAIIWFDTRTKSVVDGMIAKYGGKDAFRGITGLPLHSYFSACKIKWLIDNVEGVRNALKEGKLFVQSLLFSVSLKA